LNECLDAQRRLEKFIVRTPTIPIATKGTSASVFLKLENRQPVGAFKIRCMGNAVLIAGSKELQSGVYTASSGNAGIGLAWIAEKVGIQARIYVPEFGPKIKLDAMRKLGAQVIPLDDDRWWNIIQVGHYDSDPGMYIDAVRSRSAMAGNATIGLEIIQQLPTVDAIVVPYGGGGLLCGVAAAARALKPDIRLIVAECEVATPVVSAVRAGHPVTVEMTDSFISGAGAPFVLNDMWPIVSGLIDDAVSTSVEQVADAVRILCEKCDIVAEGAGAISVAAAIADKVGTGNVVCVVSGGNIDKSVHLDILSGRSV
jgi:threonine dehydratase